MNKTMQSPEEWRVKRLASILAATFLTTGSAAAFDIDTGNPDVAIRWDNTVRYNAAWRVGKPNPLTVNSAKFDEGDSLFGKGDMVAKRLDLLSEFDVVYKKDLGFRVSAAGWYDGAYGSDTKNNPNALPAGLRAPSYPGQKFTPYVKRYYAGPSGEILDAFVFGNFNAGEVPVRMKAGRHTVFWGESLFLNGAFHSVSYAQNPIDLQKGFATPGVEAKELFRPLNQISGQAQLTDTLSVAGQYFLQWESYRYPEGGTYLGPADYGFYGPVSYGPYLNKGALAPKDRGSQYGVSARWSPAAIDGTVGFYYRRFADMLPQPLLLAGVAPASYGQIYAGGIELFGISLSKNVGGLSVGSELSYRRNTPLLSALAPVAVPTQGNTTGPRGDTMHALVNVMGSISKTPVFDSASWAAELTWSEWVTVRSRKDLFNAEGFTGCTAAGKPASAGAPNKWDGCATKNYLGLGLSFSPTWFQVLPGVDLSAPATVAIGLKGNAPTVFAGSQGNGNFTVGLGADVHQKYRIDLKYAGYFGHMASYGNPYVVSANGLSTVLQDRDFVSLTLKTTF